MVKTFVDTNILVDFSLNNRGTAKLVDKYINFEKICVPNYVVYESRWVLKSVYKKTKEEIEVFTRNLFSDNRLVFVSEHDFGRVLELRSMYSIAFGDCVILAHMKKGDRILSFDREFDKVKWVERVELRQLFL